MAKIFISYRRADSNDESRRIYDALVESFGEANIFRDKDRIPKGSDFRKVIERYVFQSDEMLVLIGQKWLDIREDNNPDKRRLDNPEDFVRIEIELGLRHCQHVTPVVLQDANVPDEEELPRRLVQLGFQNAYFLRPNHFESDLQSLVNDIAQRHNFVHSESVNPRQAIRILNQLWPYISGRVMRTIDMQLDQGYLRVDFYERTFQRYAQTRLDYPEQFKIVVASQVESSLTRFDDELKKFIFMLVEATLHGEVGNTSYWLPLYKLPDIHPRWSHFNARRQELKQKYDDVCDVFWGSLTDAHNELIQTIQLNLSDFDFPEELP